MKSYIWGPLAPLGFALALLVFVVDQAHKWWMLNIYDIGARGPVAFTPFLDLLLVWNKGVSYGLFDTNAQGILVGLSLLVCAVLWIWLCRSHRPVTVAAIGLVIGGALANALDRLTRGAVADFFQLHWNGWSWYVFNLADVAIVAGVALLLYEFLPGTERGDRSWKCLILTSNRAHKEKTAGGSIGHENSLENIRCFGHEFGSGRLWRRKPLAWRHGAWKFLPRPAGARRADRQ